MSPRRPRLVLVAAAVTLLFGAIVAIVAAAGAAPTAPAPTGALVPPTGAYLGAYVQSAVDTRAGRIRAFLALERQMRHPLEVVHVYHPWGSDFPSPEDRYYVDNGKVLLLSWGGPVRTGAIIAGRDDTMIRERAMAVKALGHPILLEFGYEMNRPDLQAYIDGPTNFIAAWNHVRAIFRAVGAANASWVWCPTGYGFRIGQAQAYYPGNDGVDWVCADVYSTSPSEPLSNAAGPFLHWASHHDKPVIIGEFAVGGNPSGWAPWLTDAGHLAQADHQIKAMVYFDADGIDSDGRPFSYSLEHHPAAVAAIADLLRQPYFHPAPPDDP